MVNDTTFEIIGFTGGGLIVASFIPQLIKIIQNKSSNDVSLPTYFILIIAEILWITYGILKNDLQVLITNVLVLIINLLIIMTCLLQIYIKKVTNSNSNC